MFCVSKTKRQKCRRNRDLSRRKKNRKQYSRDQLIRTWGRMLYQTTKDVLVYGWTTADKNKRKVSRYFLRKHISAPSTMNHFSEGEGSSGLENYQKGKKSAGWKLLPYHKQCPRANNPIYCPNNSLVMYYKLSPTRVASMNI